jgi:hypothetical protein
LASFRESSLCPRLFSEAHPYAAAVLVDEPGVGTQKNGFVLSNGWTGLHCAGDLIHIVEATVVDANFR